MKAMILAAGYGTRLRPLTDRVPKAALPFFGRPLISHTLEWLAGHGIDAAVINLHHLGAQVRAAAEAWAPRDMRLLFIDEVEILGTGGALRNARASFGDDDEIVVVNGDVFTRLDLAVALRVHRSTRAMATLCLDAEPQHRDLFGVGLDLDKRITDFWGQPPGPEPMRRAAFTGVHITSAKLLDRLPETGFACIKERGWIPLLRDGGHLQGVVQAAPWFDIGTPERYLAAHVGMAYDAARLSGWPMVAPFVASAEPLPDGVTVRAPAAVGPGLRIDGPAEIGPNAFLGANVTLAAGSAVRDAVIWDGERVAG